MNNSRTGLRLELMREQAIRQGMPMQQTFSSSSSSNPSSVPGASPFSSNPSSLSSKTQPIIISQPIRFTGNRLVHLPPQIFHVQSNQSQGDYGRATASRATMSSSVPTSLICQTVAEGSPMGLISDYEPGGSSSSHMQGGTTTRGNYRAPSRVRTISQTSPAELSPDLGRFESSQSASFTSAHSDLDEIIIDEILSFEDDRRKQQLQEGVVGSYNSNDGSMASRLAAARQISSSAPTSSIDIEGLIHQEMVREQESMRDRRKKDIHNMIERRRRYNINDRIKELGTLLPKSCTEDVKLNKGTILKASVDYIKALHRETIRLHQSNERHSQSEMDSQKMLAHIQELESQLKAHGLPVPPTPQLSAAAISSAASPSASSALSGSRNSITPLHAIKQEPLDHDEETITGYSPQSDISSNYSSIVGNTYYNAADTPSPPLFANCQQQQPMQQYYGTISLQQQPTTQQNPSHDSSGVQSNASFGGGSYPPRAGSTTFASQQNANISTSSTGIVGGGGTALFAQQVAQPRFEPLTVYVSQQPSPGLSASLPRSHAFPQQQQAYGMSPQHALQQSPAGPSRQAQRTGVGLLARTGSSDAYGGGQPSPAQSASAAIADIKEFLIRDPMMSESRVSPLCGTGLSSPEVHWDNQTFSPGSPICTEQMDQN